MQQGEDHFSVPLCNFLRRHQIDVTEYGRNTLRVYTSFGNFFAFEVHPHMIVNYVKIYVLYHMPNRFRYRKIIRFNIVYLEHGSEKEQRTFAEFVNMIVGYQKRDAILWNSMLQKVTVFFHVLCTFNNAHYINKDIRKQIVAVFRNLVIQQTVDQECGIQTFEETLTTL